MTTRNRELAGIIDDSGNIIAGGNLTVSGTTTTVSSTVETHADPLIELNTGAGSNSNDLGFVFERGSTGDNACLIWDESNDVFAVGTTTATGTSTGNMSFTAAGLTAAVGTFSSLDISGNADIDGTLEADVITVDGTALNEYIADTVGAMVGSNTETNIAVTYEDGDNTLDFVIGTLNQDTTGTADNITITANNSTDETVYPIFVDGTSGSQGAESDSGLTYNPSSGLLTIAGELDAGSLDISGNADIDGTLETDNLTVGGAQGSDGQVLTSTGSGVAWEDAASSTANVTFTGLTKFDQYGSAAGHGRIEFGNSGEPYIQGIDTGNGGSGAYLKFGINATDVIYIKNDFNVGIGTNAPVAKLDIATAGSTAKPLAIRITNAAATNYAWEIWRDNTDGDLRFGEELAGTDTTRVTFESGGKVGIGTTSPDARLDIEGMAAGEQALLITTPRNDALSNGLARINITDPNCPFHGLQIDHAGTGSALYVNGTITIPNYESGGGQGTAGTISHKTNNYMYITGGTEALILGGATSSESGRGTIKIPEGNNDMDFNISGLTRFKVRYDYVDVGGTTVDYGRLNIKSSGASHIRMWDAGSGNTIQLHTHSVNLRMVDVPNGDACIQFEADGDIDIDGSYLTGGFDYAEYFESTDGTAIPVGTSVVLVNEKVRAATGSEQPLGVVRPGSDGTSVVGGSAGLRWTGKYLKDDYDGYLYDTVDYWVFQIDGEDKQCWSDRVPDGWVVPSEKRVTPMQRKRLNPDFVENLDSDGEQIYANRESRDEWNCIGLLGQVPITKGQATNTNWTKLKDRSETVELWFIK